MKQYKHNICFLMTSFFIFLSSFNLYALSSDITQIPKEQSIQTTELSGLFERKVLRVAMYKTDTPPFYFVNKSNELTGIDVEIIKDFARKLGLDVQFIRHAQTLDEVVDLVALGQADLAICKLSITLSRATKVLFSEPYINLHKALLINRIKLQQQLNGQSKKEAIQKLTGTLGVIGNSSYVNYAKQRFSQMTIKEYDSWKEVVDAVVSQKIVAGFRDEAEIKKVILDNKDLSLDLLTVVLKDDFDPKGIAIPPHAHHLKALLDFYINSIGLKLTANSALFEYESVIEHLNRYRQDDINN